MIKTNKRKRNDECQFHNNQNEEEEEEEKCLKSFFVSFVLLLDGIENHRIFYTDEIKQRYSSTHVQHRKRDVGRHPNRRQRKANGMSSTK